MEKLINALMEIIGNVIVIIFILCFSLIVLIAIATVFKKIILKIRQFQERSIIYIFVIINIILCIILCSRIILKLSGIKNKSWIKKSLECLSYIYSNSLSKSIIYFIGIICIIIFLAYCIVIAKIITEKIDSKYKISENKWKYTGLAFGIIFGIFIVARIVNNINENIADFLENYLCINIIFMIIKYIIFIFMILTVILAFSIFVKVIIEHEKDSDELADIKDNFSKIITEGANTACINKLCKKLQSISDEDIYMVLKSFKTPYLLGLKNILQQDKERKKNKVPKVLKSTTIFSAIGTLLKYLKDELHFNFIVLIDLIDSQKDNITIFISMIILFVCLILLDPYLSTNKERRIISSNYLILLIDDILEIKKSEEILSVKIIEKRGKRVRRPVRLGRK